MPSVVHNVFREQCGFRNAAEELNSHCLKSLEEFEATDNTFAVEAVQRDYSASSGCLLRELSKALEA
jgi:hypothetical protein